MASMALSALASLLVIILTLPSKKLRNMYPVNLVLVLAFIDFLLNTFSIVPINRLYKDKAWLCNAQGFLNQVFSLADVLWIAFMSFELYNHVYREKIRLEFGLKWPIIIISLISTLSGFPPLIYDVYDNTGAWCWIESHGNSNDSIYALRISLFYGEVWITCIWILFANYKVLRKKWDYYDRENKTIIWQLILYPAIFVFCFTFISIERMKSQNDVYKEFSLTALMSEGFLNMFVYAFTTGIIDLKSYKRKQLTQDVDLSQTASFLK